MDDLNEPTPYEEDLQQLSGVILEFPQEECPQEECPQEECPQPEEPDLAEQPNEEEGSVDHTQPNDNWLIGDTAPKLKPGPGPSCKELLLHGPIPESLLGKGEYNGTYIFTGEYFNDFPVWMCTDSPKAKDIEGIANGHHSGKFWIYNLKAYNEHFEYMLRDNPEWFENGRVRDWIEKNIHIDHIVVSGVKPGFDIVGDGTWTRYLGHWPHVLWKKRNAEWGDNPLEGTFETLGWDQKFMTDLVILDDKNKPKQIPPRVMLQNQEKPSKDYQPGTTLLFHGPLPSMHGVEGTYHKQDFEWNNYPVWKSTNTMEGDGVPIWMYKLKIKNMNNVMQSMSDCYHNEQREHEVDYVVVSRQAPHSAKLKLEMDSGLTTPYTPTPHHIFWKQIPPGSKSPLETYKPQSNPFYEGLSWWGTCLNFTAIYHTKTITGASKEVYDNERVAQMRHTNSFRRLIFLDDKYPGSPKEKQEGVKPEPTKPEPPTAIVKEQPKEQPMKHSHYKFDKDSPKNGLFKSQLLLMPNNNRGQFKHGLLDCMGDLESGCLAFCCPCEVAKQVAQKLGANEKEQGDHWFLAGPIFCCWLHIGWCTTTALRDETRRVRDIKGDRGEDCCIMGCCRCCALTQMHRELKNIDDSKRKFGKK